MRDHEKDTLLVHVHQSEAPDMRAELTNSSPIIRECAPMRDVEKDTLLVHVHQSEAPDMRAEPTNSSPIIRAMNAVGVTREASCGC